MAIPNPPFPLASQWFIAVLLLLLVSSFSKNSKEGTSKHHLFTPFNEKLEQLHKWCRSRKCFEYSYHNSCFGRKLWSSFFGLVSKVSISRQKKSLLTSYIYFSDKFTSLKSKCWYYSKINRRLSYHIISSEPSSLWRSLSSLTVINWLSKVSWFRFQQCSSFIIIIC